jgi:uncharacterized ferritin-like protein (DUF455 family)
MELRELAERIVFSKDLEAKLWCPEVITDHSPGVALPAPVVPHRHVCLKFSESKGKSVFPSLRMLEKECIRGKILHYFANHELLATELMALVILKFPDAPKSFRRGVLKTLKDEQLHTRMYFCRLKEIQVEFGQYPVNGFFWKMIAPMRTPMDYVSRLSLTFEQANLDFSKFFEGQFNQVGDLDSSKLLGRIYRDEISHVGYGLKWFRRWKEPGQTDWEAFEAQLDFPLSPRRAKASPFNVSGRERVGFDDDFIQRLHVYSKSKGRTPGVFYFNLFAEQIMAGGPGFTPNKQQLAYEEDLETILLFLARSDDVVLLRKQPRLAYLVTLKDAGLELPQIEKLENGAVRQDSELLDRKVGQLRPWAWSPDAISVLEPFKARLPQKPSPSGAAWEKEIRPMFGKDWSALQLRHFLLQAELPDWLCPLQVVGDVVDSMEQAIARMDLLRQEGFERLVVKSIFGAAGGNMLRLWETAITERQMAWIRNTLKREKRLLIEPWLDRWIDFSVHWEVEPSGIRSVGWTHLNVDARGQYRGSMWMPSFTRGLPPGLAKFAHEGEPDRMVRIYEDLANFLQPLILKTGFRGPMGLDAAIYRDPQGNPMLKPVLEINPRFTMGRLALELRRHIAPGCAGHLQMAGIPDLKKSGFPGFGQWMHALRKKYPVSLDDHGRLISGMVCLNDPSEARGCLAVWQVARHPHDCHGLYPVRRDIVSPSLGRHV